jgi:hypothetical protein
VNLNFNNGFEKLRKFECEENNVAEALDKEIESYDKRFNRDEKQIKNRYDYDYTSSSSFSLTIVISS